MHNIEQPSYKILCGSRKIGVNGDIFSAMHGLNEF